jgi:hypothetical protein
MFIENPPKKIYVSSSRLKCARNGEFEKYNADVMLFYWFIWEKGFKGDTIIKWYN